MKTMRTVGRLRAVACLAVLTLATGCALPGGRSSDPWFGRDKLYHFAGSAAISASTAAAARHNGADDAEAGMIAIGVTLSVGSAKEHYDRTVKKTYWSWKDMVWNTLGAIVGSAAVAAAD